MKSLTKLSFLVAYLFHSLFAYGNGATGVGHGDTLSLYMEATRLSLRDIVKAISSGIDLDSLCDCPPQATPDPYCRVLQAMTGSQREYCRHFITGAVEAMYHLTTDIPVTPITLTQDLIADADPLGHPRPVVAKTRLGSSGDIAFHYQDVSSLPPIALLALMGHEFGHKTKPVDFTDYVGDNEAIGPFSLREFPGGGGRALMDRVGAALATYAVRHDIIGEAFNQEDYFECKVREKSSPGSLVASGRNLRLFMGTGFDYYETGIGNIPQDISCEIDDADSGIRLFYRVKIHEEHGCAPPVPGEPALGRWSLLELWQIQPSLAGQVSSSDPTRVESKLLAGWNPLCEKDPTLPVLSLEHTSFGGKHYHFELRFQSSEGHSGARKRRAQILRRSIEGDER